MKRTGLIVLGIMLAAANISGCASVAKEVVKQVLQDQEGEDEAKEEDKKSREDSEKEEKDVKLPAQDSDKSGADGALGSEGSKPESQAQDFDSFIKNELEPRLGTAKNSQFSYGFERRNYAGTNDFFAAPITALLDSGIVSTYRRDLNKDGRDELLVIYIEGSKLSGDGKNHFLMGVYGDSGNGITEWGRLGFDECFSGHNGEEYVFGLKDVGSRQLIYTGGSGHVWSWADGSNPQIHLYQFENNQIKEIYQVSTVGSDNSWMPQWRSELQGFGFELLDNSWGETQLAGESGFEVLAYGECYTKDQGNGQTNSQQQYWIDNGLVIGGIYGPDTQMVMQMNRTMQPYAGGSSSVSSGGEGNVYSGQAAASGQAAFPGQAASGQAAVLGNGDYILPNSSTIYLTRADLAGLSQEQLRLARNEIYARHGRKFKTKEIQDYFNSKSWYTGTIESNAFKDEYLNSYEKENIKLIQSLEK